MSRIPWIVACVLAAGSLTVGVVGCSDDESDSMVGPDDDPGPHVGEDEIRFRVYAAGEDGALDLRWVGDPFGPAPESPEPTEVPYVPFGRAFRVEWDVDARLAPVVGTRFRFYESAGSQFFLPDAGADSIAFDDTRGFDFANDTPFDELDPATCGTGPLCFGDQRLPSRDYFLEVQSVNGRGRVIDDDQTLEIRVNYPPTVESIERTDGPFASPRYRIRDRDGNTVARAFSEGDTIPSGARVEYLLRGRDRLSGTVAAVDSFCCDERLDPSGPAVRYKANSNFASRRYGDDPVPRFTFVGPTSADSVLIVDVGPFDYDLASQAVDEHGRSSARDTLSFVAGFPPRAPALEPDGGDDIDLLPSDQPPPVGSGGQPLYEVQGGLTRVFDLRTGDWTDDFDIPEEQRVFVPGARYRIPLGLRSEPDPRVAFVDPEIQGDFTDYPRRFAYVWLTEFDPENRFVQGRGDRIDGFIDAETVDADGTAALELGPSGTSGFEGLEIFLPNDLFTSPWLYDPDLDPDAEPAATEATLAIAERIKVDLGDVRFRGRSITTPNLVTFVQSPPAAAGLSTTPFDSQVDRFFELGRVSPWAEAAFGIRARVVVDPGTGSQLWPPPSS